MTKKKEAEASGLTVKSFLIGIILVAAFSVWSVFVVGRFEQSLIMDMTAYSVFVIFALLLVSSALKKRGFRAQELTVIYAMLLSSLFVAVSWEMFTIGMGVATTLEVGFGGLYSPRASLLTPSFWVPKDPAVLEPMLAGGTVVPWDAWTTPIVYWLALLFSFAGFATSLTLILSHRLIVEEMLPFPMATAVNEIVQEPRKPLMQRRGFKIVLIAFVIGFVFQSFYALWNELIPAMPVIPGSYDFGPLVGAAARNAYLMITLASIPLWVGIYLLAPTDFLWTAVLMHFVLWVFIPPIEVIAGIQTNASALGTTGISIQYFTYMGTQMEPTGIQLAVLAELGFPLGVAIVFLALSGKTFGRSFKSAIKGGKTGPFSSRLIWAVFIISLVVWPGLIVISAVPIQMVVFFVLFSIAISYASLRMRGEAIGIPQDYRGLGIESYHHTMTDLAFLTVGGDAAKGTTRLYNSVYMGQIITRNMLHAPALSVAVAEGFKLGNLTNTKWRDILIASIVAFVVAILIGFPLHLWGPYTLGYEAQWPSFFISWGSAWISWELGAITFEPATYKFYTTPLKPTQLFIGIAIGAVVTLLRYRYIWFPLNPFGLIAGATLPFAWGTWFQALIALVIKYTALRIGGTKFYDEKIVPSSIGLISGWALCVILYGVIIIIKAMVV